MIRKLPLLLIFFLIPALGLGAAETEAPHALFFSANEAYREGDFEKAAELYEKIIAMGNAGADVYYNLGNTCFRLDRPGLAILNLEKAKILAPRDPDVDFNLRYVRDRIQDQAEKGSRAQFWSWTSIVSDAEVFRLFALATLLASLALALRVFKKNEGTFYLVIALALLWVVVGVFAGLKAHQTATDTRGVVVEPRIDVRAGPDPRDTLLFQLHEGSLVRREAREPDAALVRFGPEKRGWTKSSGVAFLRPLPPAPEPETP